MWENLSQYENLMKFNLAGEQVPIPWVFFIFFMHLTSSFVTCKLYDNCSNTWQELLMWIYGWSFGSFHAILELNLGSKIFVSNVLQSPLFVIEWVHLQLVLFFLLAVENVFS